MRKEVYPPSKNRTGGQTERTKTVPNDQSFKNVPNDYLGMSCGGIGIVLRPPAPIQSLFHRNLEEDRKSPVAGAAGLLEGNLVVRAR